MKPITREELRGITVLDLICLHVNRANDIVISPKQIKLKQTTRQADGTVKVVLEPSTEVNWNNGPIEVVIPSVNVNEVYPEEVVIDFTTIGTYTLDEVLKLADLPPCPPATVDVKEYLMLDPGQELKIKYNLLYSNAFFTGTAIVRVANAPNNLDSLRTLNKLFLGE